MVSPVDWLVIQQSPQEYRTSDPESPGEKEGKKEGRKRGKEGGGGRLAYVKWKDKKSEYSQTKAKIDSTTTGTHAHRKFKNFVSAKEACLFMLLQICRSRFKIWTVYPQV